VTVGIADGSIIAAIITIQTPGNQPSVPSPPGARVHPAHALDRRPPAGRREREEQRHEAALGAGNAHPPE
jgi:hypothetical protein